MSEALSKEPDGSESESRLKQGPPRWLPWTVGALVVALPLMFVGYLSGDAVIHLVFAENAMQGDWFAFNPGEHIGGETSLGYLLVVTGLWRLVGQAGAPYAMVALGYVAWLATLAIGWRLVKAWYPRSVWPCLWLGMTGLMPGSVFNSMLGMENVLMALPVLVLTAWLYRSHALERLLSVSSEAALAASLGALTWLRPEALPFAAMLLGWRTLTLAARIGWWRSMRSQALLGLGVAFLFAASVAVHWQVSGVVPFSGGVARLNLAASHGLLLGGVLPLHGKMALRLAIYFPLTALFAFAVWTWRREPQRTQRGVVGLAIVLVVGFVVLFSTVLPTFHLSRYTIFLWPLMTLVATFGLATCWDCGGGRWLRYALAALVCALLAVYGVELRMRSSMRHSQHSLYAVAHAADHRRAATDALLVELGHTGPVPIGVGLVEVQMRYFYDNRVIVRTMDGIIDYLFNAFAYRTREGVVYDYMGYLKARRMDYILEYGWPVAPLFAWSPAALREMAPGTFTVRDGVRFERLPGRATRLTYLPTVEQ